MCSSAKFANMMISISIMSLQTFITMPTSCVANTFQTLTSDMITIIWIKCIDISSTITWLTKSSRRTRCSKKS
ncbi:hypothetical protein X975_12648, partial [Stegodyphus mimosarum]